MRQYRIKELDGEFIIEGAYSRTSGFLFKNTETIWARLDIKHNPIGSRVELDRFNPPIPPPLKTFVSNQEALNYINSNILEARSIKNPKYMYLRITNGVATLKPPTAGSTYEV